MKKKTNEVSREIFHLSNMYFALGLKWPKSLFNVKSDALWLQAASENSEYLVLILNVLSTASC